MNLLEKNKALWRVLIFMLAAGLLVFLSFFLSNKLKIPLSYKVVQEARVYIFSHISNLGSFISKIKTIGNLVRENIELQEKNSTLISQIAANSALKEENIFLREALGLDLLNMNEVIDARAFNIQLAPDGHHMLINKGREAGIEKGDAIIASSGVLIGQVSETSDNFSKVDFVTNADNKITVRLLSNNTAGISRGSLGAGLIIDFISQNDEIAEGDIIVTSGNDNFPAGLIVGTISHISSDDGNIFKNVTAKAEFQSISIDRILVIRK